MKAVAFAYHNVGAHCVPILLAHGIEVPLVLTHADSANENIWFDSVAAVATKHRIPITTEDPNLDEMVARIHELQPDFIFSFYYRQMLKSALLAIPKYGALNIHGSLLPKYRGRSPVNWAVINGETQTGATLHYMVEKPDAGDIVAQQALPIFPDDSALDVFKRLTVAATEVLDHSLPALLAGRAPRRTQDLSQGSYFGGRRPEDGRIDWTQPAANIHNLVRGVAPPYPGAFTELGGKRLDIFRTKLGVHSNWHQSPGIYVTDSRCFAVGGDRRTLELIEMQYERRPFAAKDFVARFGTGFFPLK